MRLCIWEVNNVDSNYGQDSDHSSWSYKIFIFIGKKRELKQEIAQFFRILKIAISNQVAKADKVFFRVIIPYFAIQHHFA